MKHFFNPETWALNLATLGYFGRNKLGRFIAPLFAIAIVGLGRTLYAFSKDLFYIPLILSVVIIIWIVNFAYENMPLERHSQIVLPLIPGMATALLKLPLKPNIILASFVLFWITYIGLEFWIDKILASDLMKEEDEDPLADFEEDELEETQIYTLPSNKQYSIYEILMIPIGAGSITVCIIHICLFLLKKI